MFKIETGSNKSLFTLIAVVIFGIFLSLSYWLFQDEFKGILASVVDGVKSGPVVRMDDVLKENVELVTTPENYFVFNSSTGTITGYLETGPKDVVIPSKIAGVDVTSIGAGAFGGRQLTSVIIANSIKTIGDGAFNTNLLTSVTIPNTVTSIGVASFNTNKLTSVVIGTGLTSIPAAAFLTNNLTSVSIPTNITSIGSSAFVGNKITSVELPNSVTSVGWGSFQTNPITAAKVSNLTTINPESFPVTTVITRY